MTELCPSDDADASPGRHAARPAIRIGAVSYLNSKPLIEGLRNATDDHQLILDYPSRLADSLAHGDMDVALIPSIEVIRSHGDYEIVSNACVAAHGPVRSVKGALFALSTFSLPKYKVPTKIPTPNAVSPVPTIPSNTLSFQFSFCS